MRWSSEPCDRTIEVDPGSRVLGFWFHGFILGYQGVDYKCSYYLDMQEQKVACYENG